MFDKIFFFSEDTGTVHLAVILQKTSSNERKENVFSQHKMLKDQEILYERDLTELASWTVLMPFLKAFHAFKKAK